MNFFDIFKLYAWHHPKLMVYYCQKQKGVDKPQKRKRAIECQTKKDKK